MPCGVIPVLYSYFTASGAIDLDAHERQLRWTRSAGAAGVTLFGLASEGAALSAEERRAVLASTCAQLPAADALLVTVRPDDDIRELSRCALAGRERPARRRDPRLRAYRAVCRLRVAGGLTSAAATWGIRRTGLPGRVRQPQALAACAMEGWSWTQLTQPSRCIRMGRARSDAWLAQACASEGIQ